MNKKIIFLLLFFIPFLDINAQQVDTIQKYEEEINKNMADLSQIQQRINQLKNEKEKLEKDQTKVSGELKEIQKKLAKEEENLKKTKKELENTRNILQDKKKKTVILKNSCEQEKELICAGINRLYREEMNTVLPKNAEDVLKEKFIKNMISKSGQNYVKFNQRYQQTVKEEKEFTQKSSLLSKQMQFSDQQLKNYLFTQKQKKELNEQLLAKKQKYLEEISQLEETATQLQELIDNFEKKKSKIAYEEEKGKYFLNQKGRIPWPIEGEIITHFGKQKHPVLDTQIIVNGIEIKGSGGKPIKAISAGQVVFVNKFKSYGEMIILDHGGGYYSIYAQIENPQVKVGDVVEKAAILAYLPFDKNEAVLYFEIRDKGQPVDPLLWLRGGD